MINVEGWGTLADGVTRKADDALLEHDRFVQRAQRIFGNPPIVSYETYEVATERMLSWVRKFTGVLTAEERWALVVESAWRVVAESPEPYSSWAYRLIEEKMEPALRDLHAVGAATRYPTSHPSSWDRPNINLRERMTETQYELLCAALGK